MSNLKIYCLSLSSNHFNLINQIGYIPVGLGESFFSKGWVTDKSGKNISTKNPYYGEYTFHYYLWKNNLLERNKWIGFCQYRKFWGKENIAEDIKISSFDKFNSLILKNIPKKLDIYQSILGNEMFINNFRLSKFIKRNFKKMLLNPSLFLNKNKRTIKFHFDMWHGHGNLDKAINLLDKSEKKDFNHFVETETSFNPHNMFICRDKDIIMRYYESVFPWLKRCESVFGFNNLKGYGLKRIYGFLAERYLSYWFKKYTKFYQMPILFKDITDFKS